jgi:hypothetical protein
MRGRIVLVVVLVVLGALVAALNWQSMRTPVFLDLLFTSVVVTVGAIVALVTATLLAIFLFAGLLDRSRQLHQVGVLERQLDDARHELERKRAADIEALGGDLEDRLEAAVSRVEGTLSRLQDRIDARIEEARADVAARVEAVRERVVVVRDELAADIAEVEDALLRRRIDAPTLGEEPLDEIELDAERES